MRLLIGVTSPRDLPEFLEATAKLKFDKFWAKYYIEYPAFQHVRNFFLAHKEYSHLAILCDDLVVKQEQATALFEETVRNDYPVLGGLCYVNRDVETPEFKDMLNISLTHTTDPVRSRRRYEFMTKAQYEEYGALKPTVKTAWQGFPFSIIRRDIVERFDFRTDGFYNNPHGSHKLDGKGCCTDNVFNWELAQAGIPMYSNLNILMHHIPDSRYDCVGVNKFPAYTFLECFRQ